MKIYASQPVRQRFLLNLGQALEQQHTETTAHLRDLLDRLNCLGDDERAYAEADRCWKESAEGVAARVRLMAAENDLTEEIDLVKVELKVTERRLGDLYDVLKVFD